MFYLLIFGISILFLLFAFKIKKKIVSKFLIFVGLLIPCIVAGLRHYTVGTDTGGHILNLYRIATTAPSFEDFKNTAFLIYNCKDILYLCITYFFGHFNISFQLMLFLFEVLIVFPIYFSLKKIKINNFDIVFGMTLFYLTLYNLSLNMIRQSIAIAFLLLSFSIFIKSSNKKQLLLSLLLFIIAVEFHDTALYMFPIYIFYLILNSEKIKERDKNFIVLIIILLAILFLFFYKPILSFIGNSGIYPKALWYLNRHSSFDIDYTGTLKNILVAFFILRNKSFFNKNNINYKFGVLVSFLNIIINCLGAFVTYSDRIAYYLFYLVLANYIALLTKNNINNNKFQWMILVTFILYWTVVILLHNGSQTLPYIIFNKV